MSEVRMQETIEYAPGTFCWEETIEEWQVRLVQPVAPLE